MLASPPRLKRQLYRCPVPRKLFISRDDVDDAGHFAAGSRFRYDSCCAFVSLEFAMKTSRPTNAEEQFAREQCHAVGVDGSLEEPKLAALKPGFYLDDDNDELARCQLEEVFAIEMYREDIRRAEQLALDEAVAYSLYAKDERRLVRHQLRRAASGEDADSWDDDDVDSEFDDENSVMVPSAADLLSETKPAPACTCCLVCLPDASVRRTLPCGHLYCTDCIATRCGMAVRDRSLVPAHCCRKEFPIDYVRAALSSLDASVYEQFLREKHWTSLDLESDREYVNVVRDIGGVQCPGCGIGVQKISGCNRMVCCYGHEFCYRCGRKWKTCGCAYP